MLIQCKENGAVLDNYSNLSNPIFPLAVLWSSPSPSAGFCSKSRARSSCETSKKVFVRHSDYNTNYVLILLHSYLEENIVGTEKKRDATQKRVAKVRGDPENTCACSRQQCKAYLRGRFGLSFGCFRRVRLTFPLLGAPAGSVQTIFPNRPADRALQGPKMPCSAYVSLLVLPWAP